MKNKKPQYPLLGGLLACDECGGRFYPRYDQRKNGRVLSYRDSNQNRVGSCTAHSTIGADSIHRAAEEIILDTLSPDIFEDALSRAQEILESETGLDRSIEKALQNELRDLTIKRDNLLDVLMSMSDSPGVQDRLRSIENDIASKAAQSDDLRDQLRKGIEPAMDFLGGVKAGAISLQNVWSNGSEKERQGVARSIINWIRISSDRASFHGEFSPVPTGQSFRSGGGTRTPDTRIMIPLL